VGTTEALGERLGATEPCSLLEMVAWVKRRVAEA
jgi:hypothetical protein